MLDIDGTLTQSYEYDQVIFGRAIAEVLSCPPVNADLNGFIDKTSSGVTWEAIRRVTGTNPTADQIEQVKRNVQSRLEAMYQSSPQIFCEIPGAAHFLDQLRRLNGLGIVIATGCWTDEALFKLRASGLNIAAIPMATSDDDMKRMRIMQIAVEKAQAAYTCPGFERVVYLGDGPWDLEEAHSLGYSFIGIGPRVYALRNDHDFLWHSDFMELQAVLASIKITLRS